LIDNHNRKINYLRLSVTDLCNLRCLYCMPGEGVEKKCHNQIFRIEELVDLVRTAAELGVKKVRLTGGEPLIRRGNLVLVEQIKAIPGIDELTLTTNGLLLSDQAAALKEAGLDRVNISLDTLKPERFHLITRRDDFNRVMKGIDQALAVGLTPLKINVVLLKGVNDDEIPDFADLARRYDIEIRFIELMPVGEASAWGQDYYLSNRVVLDALPELGREGVMAPGQPSEVFHLKGGRGRIGLINPISHKFCSHCNRLRISADGKLMPCLHSNQSIDIRALWNQGMTTAEIFRQAVDLKPKEHRLDLGEHQEAVCSMHSVGG